MNITTNYIKQNQMNSKDIKLMNLADNKQYQFDKNTILNIVSLKKLYIFSFVIFHLITSC